MSVPAIEALSAALSALGPTQPSALPANPWSSSVTGGGFSQWLTHGLDQVNDKILKADTAVQAFAVDDSMPVHQVTYALAQAQFSFELMMQVRTHLIEVYQEFSRMQL
jgi:flagellar hook-basal body complex protein FliE